MIPKKRAWHNAATARVAIIYGNSSFSETIAVLFLEDLPSL
jgi:hypothetical protein